jgi:hypothetical protein
LYQTSQNFITSKIHKRIQNFRIETRLLESTEEKEIESSIFAIDNICSSSNQFSIQIFTELCSKIKDYNTSISFKLKLIRILSHMHGDTKLIQKAYNECLELLNIFSSKEFVVIIIQTISNLVQNSMIIAKDAVFL